MGSLPPLANNNLTQILFALLPDQLSGQNIGKKEKLSEIQDLLKHGVDINAEICPGFTPLCKIIKEKGSKTLIEVFLQNGARIDVGNPSFEWIDKDGEKIHNQVFALARQRYLQYQDKESLEIQHLIQKYLIQKHLESNGNLCLRENPFNTEIFKPPRHKSLQPFPLTEVTQKKKIYIFDFEQTIVNADFHLILKQMGVRHGSASPDLVEFLLSKYGLRHQSMLLEVFQTILENDHCLCIATQSRYPETVWASLAALGLSEELQNKILYKPACLETEFDLTVGKNEQILQAMLHFEVIDINTVYLIDHERSNLQIARGKLNMPESNLILVDENEENTEWNYLHKVLNTLKKRQAIPDFKLSGKMMPAVEMPFEDTIKEKQVV